MKIYYDNIIFNLQKAGGISVYWYELISRLLRDSNDVAYIETSDSNNIFRKELRIDEKLIIKEKNIAIKILRYLNLTCKLESNSIFHSSYYRISKQKNIKNIVTVHDFTYEYFVKGLAKEIHVLQKKHAIENANGIICVSENTKKDLLKFYPHINKDKIEVIYNGVSEEFYPIKKDIDHKYRSKKYILFVGDRSNYKNFDIAIGVIENLKNFELIIVGGKDLSQDEKSKLDEVANGRYEQVKGISTQELNQLYNYAFCLLYPSSYEGFGIPVIEAMKSGCPVVAMNKSSIPEVGGEAALLVDNHDCDKFIEQILKLENSSYRDNIKQVGFEQASKFSWEQTYKQTINFYDKIYSYHN